MGASGRGMEGRWKARGGIISAGVVAGSVLMMRIWVWAASSSISNQLFTVSSSGISNVVYSREMAGGYVK